MGKKSKVSRVSVCQKKQIAKSHCPIADDLHNFLKKEGPIYEKFCNMREYDMFEDLTELILHHHKLGRMHSKNKHTDFDDLDNCDKTELRNEVINIITQNFKSTVGCTVEMEDKISEWASQLLHNACSNQAGPSSRPCALKIAHEEVFVFHDDSDSGEESESSCNHESIIPGNVKVSKIKSIPEKSSKINAIFNNFANSLPFCVANIYSLTAELRSAMKVINGVGWKIFITTHFHKNHNDPDKSLSFYVQCCPNSYDDRWKVKANCELSIYSHANKCWKVGYQFSHVFNSTYDDCGLVHFIKWKDLFDSDEKYALDGKVYLEAIIDVKGPVQVSNFNDYLSRLEMYSSIFDIQMSRGNKREAEEVCDLALKYCQKTDRKAIKIFEDKRSLLVQDKVADTITRLQQEHLQNVDKGTSLKKKASLRNFCFTGICKRKESVCNHVDIRKNNVPCSNGKVKKTEVFCDNHECENSKKNGSKTKNGNVVERRIIPQRNVCDCGNTFSESLKTCKDCEDQYFMRTLFFERKNYMFPFTVYNRKRLFILPDNYIVGGDNEYEKKIEKCNEEVIRDRSLENISISEESIRNDLFKSESLRTLTERERKPVENYSVENFYYDKVDYLNFIAKRTTIISRYLDKLSRSTSKETKKLVVQFYENDLTVDKEKLLTSIKDDALAFYLRIIPFWLMEENENLERDTVFLDFDNDAIYNTIEAAFCSVNILKAIPGSRVKDEKISLFFTDRNKFIESLNSVCIVPQSLIETIKEILQLWSAEFNRFTLTMRNNQKRLMDSNDNMCKKYSDLYKSFTETKEMFDSLSKSYSNQAKTVSMFNEVKKKCEEYKKENEVLTRSNQSIADSKKNLAKELASLKEQNKLLNNQLQEKNAALKKLKKVAEQEKVAANKENEVLKARCIRSELMYLEKNFSIGIKELNKAKEEALEYINVLKNVLNNVDQRYTIMVNEKIKEFEDYTCQVEEKIETATQSHKIHSASIEEGKSLSQIGKIKILKPKSLPEKLNSNLFTKLDVVWCDNVTSQRSPTRNGRINNKELKIKSNGGNRKRLNSSPTSDAFSCSSGESRKIKDVFTDCGYYITSVSPISYDNTLSTFDVNNFLTNKIDSCLKYGTEYQNSNHSMFSPTDSSSSFETLKFPNTTNIFGKQNTSDDNRGVLPNIDYIGSVDSILTSKKEEISQWYGDSNIMMASQNFKPLSQEGSIDLKKYTRDCEKLPSDDYQALYKAFCSSNPQKSDW